MNTAIQQQMEMNERTYQIASKSKESAIRFSADAGIIEKQKPATMPEQPNNQLPQPLDTFSPGLRK